MAVESLIMEKSKHVVMVAAENGALSGGKVGGVADVIRDLPQSLAALGWRVSVIIPSYGFLHLANPSDLVQTVVFPFQGRKQRGEIWRVKNPPGNNRVTQYVFEHTGIRGEPIYYNDPQETPFIRDATKYALFCSAVGQFLLMNDPPDVLHLHDWHAATILLLAELHPDFAPLREMKTGYTIHNLSIQGTRPMEGDPSSVEGWFPELFQTRGWISVWQDARYTMPCHTPMAVGIRFADKVNTVSPTYAREILRPSDPSIGAFRGEGLEDLLQNAHAGKRLSGILNGCRYSDGEPEPRLPFPELCSEILHELRSKPMEEDHRVAERKLKRLQTANPSIILTSVTRTVEQKARLFFERGKDGRAVFDHLNEMLESRNGVFFILGSGTSDYEEKFIVYTQDKPRLVFIRGYYEGISPLLYRNGRLFLMPSLFEPCGISQMMAMREGQPCLVHFIGGLCDTVIDMENGFGFEGESFTAMADNFVNALGKVFGIYFGNRDLWSRIEREALNARFTWEESAKQYMKYIYVDPAD